MNTSPSFVKRLMFCHVLMALASDSVGQVVIGPDKPVTHIVEPLDESGNVDYVEAANRRYSQGVSAATNWEVALLREFGPPNLSTETTAEYWRRLGIQPITSDPAQPFLRGYRSGDEYSELDNKASESFFNSDGPWTSAQFPHEARWLEQRKAALDRLVIASTREHNYVPRVSSAQDHANLIQRITDSLGERLTSEDPDERAAAAMVKALFAGMNTQAAPLSRLHGESSLHNSRDLARMLFRRALLRVGEADTEGAQSDLLAIHRIAWQAGKGSLHQWINGQALEEMASHGDLDLVESNKLSREECKQYLLALKQLPSHRKVADILDVEQRHQALDAIQFAAIHHEDLARQMSEAKVADELILRRIQKLDWPEVMRQVNCLFDQHIALHRSPERRAELIKYESIPDQLYSEEDDTVLIKRARAGQAELTKFMAEMYFKAFSPRTLRNIESRPKTRRRVVMAGLAAKLYYFEHGVYPNSLDLLRPLVDEPLVDVLTDKPFRLKTAGEGIRIYALGLNGTDEGGVDGARIESWSGTGDRPDDIAVHLKNL